MKLFLWVLLGFAVAGLAFWWLVVSDANPLAVLVYAVVVAVGTLGAFWMMYMSVRYERHPWSMILLAAFVPFSCLWYYFERVRPLKRPVWR